VGGIYKRTVTFKVTTKLFLVTEEVHWRPPTDTKKLQAGAKKVLTLNKGYNHGYTAVTPGDNRHTKVKRRLQWGAIEII
jgi:hypothetical protein